MNVRQRRADQLLPWAFPALLIGAWEAAVRFGLLPPSQAAAPTEVLGRLTQLIVSGPLAAHAAISLLRLAAGISLGALLGIASGLAIAMSRRLTLLLSPTLHWLAGVPVVLWIPFCVMIFGTGEMYKIGITAIAAYFLLYTATFYSARSTERVYTELADIYEKSLRERLQHVVVPSSTDAALSGVRAALIFGWVVLFFVEYASSRSGREGLGWFVADARSVGKIEEEFAGLVLLAVLAYAVDRGILFLQRRRSAWRDVGSHQASIWT